MKKSLLLYGLAIATAAFVLQWLEYLVTVRRFSNEIYIALIAVFFTALGIWVGRRLAGGGARQSFERNTRAIEVLGITERECEVLELLAHGHSNKEIAERLFVSANTVKTHLAHLYDKLEVSRRTQAVQKARALRMLP